MGDMGDIFRAMTKARKGRAADRLEKAQDTNIDWTRHTDYHWSIDLNGNRLDYWPSTGRWRYRDTTRFGSPERFIIKRMS